ncbi:MAG TPA: M20/M25/M40 family metallo-hydrolase [Candidatus Obscuribacterales bacterium]
MKTHRTVLTLLLVSLICVVSILSLLGCTTNMPGRSYAGALPPLTPEEVELQEGLRKHVHKLADELGERNVFRPDALESAASYLVHSLKSLGYRPAIQEIQSGGRKVKNIEAELSGQSKRDEILIVGAHYDSVFGSPGANDNGSGVAAVLELARLFRKKRPERTIRFVFFTNEEPPNFGSENMGSWHYARRCRESGEKVVAMFSIETIGYYSDRKGSQEYPAPFSLFYPDTANFIGFVANPASKDLLFRSIASFRRHTQFPSEGIAAPSWISGIDWSDHACFWKFGYPALMITDTAPFRYPYYHTREDTADKVDYQRTARVVAGISRVIAELSGKPQS